ncbi:MAG: hypothetical protein Fur0042_17870 [Cyanophyceae cyanobacterium]
MGTGTGALRGRRGLGNRWVPILTIMITTTTTETITTMGMITAITTGTGMITAITITTTMGMITPTITTMGMITITIATMGMNHIRSPGPIPPFRAIARRSVHFPRSRNG